MSCSALSSGGEGGGEAGTWNAAGLVGQAGLPLPSTSPELVPSLWWVEGVMVVVAGGQGWGGGWGGG